MCGLCGVIEPGPLPEAELRHAIGRMNDTLVHRGPDDQGLWLDPEDGVALGHRRLSILDLSPLGHQPMVSPCGRYVLVFNGEIYNYMELRRTLADAFTWRGHSDTEVLLAWILLRGVEATLAQLNGMFAFALWDRRERRLTLARDRLGEKPLYFGWNGGRFLFGSELKALRAHPGWRGEVDRDALAAYLRLGYVPAPYSIYQGIGKLWPGCFATLDLGQRVPAIRPYWSAKEAAERGMCEPFQGGESEALEALEGLLLDAVGLRMHADVPLGAFLSGGIDSSTVVALMQAQSTRPVRTFSIGFHEEGFDEAQHARRVATHLGTDHTELYVTGRDSLDAIPRLPPPVGRALRGSRPRSRPCWSAPMARRDVTVCLSGDGGDELFGGYSRYLWTRDTWSRIGWIPLVAAPRPRTSRHRDCTRDLGPTAATHWPDASLGPWRSPTPGDRLHKAIDILTGDSPEALYLRMVSHWKDPAAVVIGAREPRDRPDRPRATGPHRLHHRVDDVHGQCPLPARRHPGEVGSRQHGGRPGVAGAAARSPGLRVRLVAAPRLEGARAARKDSAPPDLRAPRSARPAR